MVSIEFDVRHFLSFPFSESFCFSDSLAASLLPAGSAATAGFGGYLGSSRLESSLGGCGGDDAACVRVILSSSFYVNLSSL